MPYPPGLRVRHITSSAPDDHEPNATVLRTTDYGDIVIEVDGDPVPINTRSCFLIP